MGSFSRTAAGNGAYIRSKLNKRKNLSIDTNFKTERHSPPPPPPPTTDILTSIRDPSYFLTFEIVTFFIYEALRILVVSRDNGIC